MKKPFFMILAALIVIDVIAMAVWFKYKSAKEKQAEPTIAAITPVGPPPESQATERNFAPAPQPVGALSGSDYNSGLYGPGISPGGCDSIAACEEYCLRPKNEAECIAWTQSDETKNRQKREAQEPADSMMPTMPMMGVVITPGDCRGSECATYCSDKNNIDECVDFCSIPKNQAECKKWGIRSRAIKDAMEGSLVSDEAIIDEDAFRIMEGVRG